LYVDIQPSANIFPHVVISTADSH